ncbi:Nuclear transcription factor Y subunit C-2 [Wallemia ichthyophaga EXF-994]|uniref:Nuclear transcription factor Y subunit C-2 n=1 Tax=Wallemia ichthyophaga (strain EXF-994 / CBS 113033) TaxID=1299270 RepID=R9AKW5_WALI9|nr:Nuclear transcription factor Y subunit C-2 [Wallemia ichthyophaga EXF-994]EOR02853.1 Nuclear transcription factor Y subunit C-2 [Wallemia ichthyophaga EXF-994]
MSLIRSGQTLDEFLSSFWTSHLREIENEDSDFKKHDLPLARIKKVMKSDPSVKMISGEAPILFSKACEIFISELTCRAWLVAESNKRRTLQRSDVAGAVELSDQFDFLIDILPRGEEANKRSKSKAAEADVEREHEEQEQEQDQEQERDQEQEYEQNQPQHQEHNQNDVTLSYSDHSNDPAPSGYLQYDTDFLLDMIGSSPNNAQQTEQR